MTLSSLVTRLAPAGVAFAVLTVLVQVRMDEAWGDGSLFVLALLAAAALALLTLAAPAVRDAPATVTLLVAALVCAGVALFRLGDVLADDFTSRGGGLSLLLALFLAHAAFLTARTGSEVGLMIAALAAVALVLELVNWIGSTEDDDVFRAVLAVAFAALLALGWSASDLRRGTALVSAAGILVILQAWLLGGLFVFADGTEPWGWELVLLAEAVALAVYAAVRRERGPGYLAFFSFVLFASTAGALGLEEADEAGVPGSAVEPSLMGWPLVVALVAIAAVGWAVRGADAGRDAG